MNMDGYPDTTAEKAIARVMKQERNKRMIPLFFIV